MRPGWERTPVYWYREGNGKKGRLEKAVVKFLKTGWYLDTPENEGSVAATMCLRNRGKSNDFRDLRGVSVRVDPFHLFSYGELTCKQLNSHVFSFLLEGAFIPFPGYSENSSRRIRLFLSSSIRIL